MQRLIVDFNLLRYEKRSKNRKIEKKYFFDKLFWHYLEKKIILAKRKSIGISITHRYN